MMPEPSQIYNSRILKSYVHCLESRYPKADIEDILKYAQISKFEVQDPGHWFTQAQVNRFFSRTVEATGNPSIAREAGQYAVFNQTADPLRQLVLGLLKVSSIYLLLAKLYPLLSRASTVKTQKLASNRVRILVTPRPGIQESPHQCENRIGIFEALTTLFANDYAQIEHPACIHRGDRQCIYMVTWRQQGHWKWKRLCAVLSAVSIPSAVIGFFSVSLWPWIVGVMAASLATMGSYLRACVLEKRTLTHTIQNQGNVAEDHIREIDQRYRGALLIQRIGQATSAMLDVDKLSTIVLENIRNYLEFDRGIIMLADKERKRLLYSAGYGFDAAMADLLAQTRFRLDNPDAKGVFVQVFHEQRPILVDDIDVLKDAMSLRSQELIRQIGSKSLICLPIVYENQSLGIMAVDNLITKRPLTQSDMNLLMGVAYQAAVSIVSAAAYHELQNSEARYRSLFENAPTAYISLRIEDAVIINCNSAAIRLLGLQREDLLGSSLWCHVADDRQSRDKADWMQRQLMDGQAVHNEAIALTGRDEHPVWVNVSLQPFRNLQNQIVEGRCILVDTTMQKQLEEQLRQAQRMEAIGTLAGGVAHDLSNILSAIVSYPDLLLMDVPPESPLHDPLVKIKGAGKRAAAIVQDLLTLSRRGVAVTEVLSLNQVVEAYLASPEYDDLVKHHADIYVEIALSPELAAIKGSAIHLTKTIMNVMLNAAEAMPQGGRIQLLTRNQTIGADDRRLKGEPGEYAVLSVSDNGYGIAPEDIRKVFEPFFTKKVMGRSGTGLGMAIVWAAVQDLKGFIDIHSQVGCGTQVELFFPATTEKQASQPLKDMPVENTGRGETVLVIDDNDEHREIANRMLERLGYRVIAVESGEAVLEKFSQSFTPDLVLIDILLEQGLDGLATLQRILEIAPKQKAVVTSGFAESNRVKKAQELGAAAYLKKPYSLREIGAIVRQVLNDT
jgi:PAS domain S-box-containing protein